MTGHRIIGDYIRAVKHDPAAILDGEFQLYILWRIQELQAFLWASPFKYIVVSMHEFTFVLKGGYTL